MKGKLKRIIAMMLLVALVCTNIFTAWALIDLNPSDRKSAQDPFSLMYDSNEKLAQELEKLPGFETAQVGTEQEPGVSLPDKNFPNKNISDESIVETATREKTVDLAKQGSFEAIRALDLPEQVAREVDRLIENAGESRFIVKYKAGKSTSVMSETALTGTSTPIGDKTELITLNQKVNPKDFADELKAAGMASQIEYMQPDFGLSIDNLGLAN